MAEREAMQKALQVLEEIALDLVNAQLAEYRQIYRGGYKPHRIAAAQAEVTAVEGAIADLRAAIGVAPTCHQTFRRDPPMTGEEK